MISGDREEMFHVKHNAFESAKTLAESLEASPNTLKSHGLSINQDGVSRNALDLLAYPDIDISKLTPVWPELEALSGQQSTYLKTHATYAGYLERQARDIEAFRRDAGLRIPVDLKYEAIGGLSNEVRQKLLAAKPETLGQASNLEGVTPGALMAVLAYLKKQNRAA